MGNSILHFFENTEKLKKEKLERLSLDYRRRMYYIASQLLHDEMEAEDVEQDVFFIIKEGLDDVDEKNRHKTMSFFAVTEKHLALDKICKRSSIRRRNISIICLLMRRAERIMGWFLSFFPCFRLHSGKLWL